MKTIRIILISISLLSLNSFVFAIPPTEIKSFQEQSVSTFLKTCRAGGSTEAVCTCFAKTLVSSINEVALSKCPGSIYNDNYCVMQLYSKALRRGQEISDECLKLSKVQSGDTPNLPTDPIAYHQLTKGYFLEKCEESVNKAMCICFANVLDRYIDDTALTQCTKLTNEKNEPKNPGEIQSCLDKIYKDATDKAIANDACKNLLPTAVPATVVP